MPRYKILARPKGKTLTHYKKKGYPTGYTVVNKGSAEGGGTRFFSNLALAQRYAKSMGMYRGRGYATKIVEAPIRRRTAKKTQPSFGWGW